MILVEPPKLINGDINPHYVEYLEQELAAVDSVLASTLYELERVTKQFNVRTIN